jgi:hypothetical protein
MMKKVLLTLLVATISLGAFSQSDYFWGIFHENANITEGLVVVGDTSFGNWNGWTALPMGIITDPFVGDSCLSLLGSDTWLGWGITSQDNMDFGDFYEEGVMHLALKVSAEAADQDTFRIGIKTQSDPTHEFAIFFYGPDLDPYDFERNGEWHELKIPFKDFVQRDGWEAGEDYTIARSDLERMRNPFLMGAQNGVSLNVDEIWWAKGTADPGATNVENQSREEFRVFPNPAERFIYLRGIDGYDRLEVYDLSGKRVKSMNKLNRGMMDVSDMSPGVYILQVTGEGKTFTSKLVKR